MMFKESQTSQDASQRKSRKSRCCSEKGSEANKQFKERQGWQASIKTKPSPKVLEEGQKKLFRKLWETSEPV